MPSPSDASFRAHLSTVDHGTATAFVAAVYEARGWAVDDGGDDLRATPPGADRPRRLVVRVGDGEDAGREADAVDGADPIGVDAATLHELVAYALPAAERTRLCREFLGREFEAFDAPPTTQRADAEPDRNGRASVPREAADAGRTRRERGDETPPLPSEPTDDGRIEDATVEREGESTASGDARQATTRRRRRLARALVVVVALSLVLGGLVTAAGPGLTASAAAILGGTGTGTTDDTGGQADGGQPAANGSSIPGLDGNGVDNARRLADAHETALGDRSFRLRIVYREYDADGIRGVAHERAVVAASGRYRSDVGGVGTVEHGSAVIGAAATYSDGERRYVRSPDGDAAGESPTVRSRSTMTATEPSRFVDRTERYVRWYLSVNESRHVGTIERDGTTLYVIDFEGDPWPAATDVSGRALVSERGVVREIRRTHVPRRDRSVRVEVVIRITPEPVRVTRPGWVPTDDPRHGVAAPNGTAGGNDTDAAVPRPPRNASAVDTSRPVPAVVTGR